MRRRHDNLNIPIELLRSFVSIQESGSYTKSADLLRLTQPAISAQIKRLQQLVGGEVFVKSAFGVSLTEKGEIVSRYARRILAMNDQILSLSGLNAASKSLRIGLPNVFAPLLLADVVAACKPSTPNDRLQFSCEPSPDLVRSLASGYLDLAMIVAPASGAMQPAFKWAEKMCWVCAPDFLLSPGAPIPLLSWPQGLSDLMAIDVLEAAGLQYSIVFVASDLAGHFAALRCGMGYIIMPDRVVPPDLKIAREHYLPQLPAQDAGVFIREGMETPEALAMAECLANVMAPKADPPAVDVPDKAPSRVRQQGQA